MMQALFIDNLGQVFIEMLAVLDVILHKVRNSNICLGGLLIIGNLDHRHPPPVNGRLLMASPHILTSFESIILKHSVRTCGDPDF